MKWYCSYHSKLCNQILPNINSFIEAHILCYVYINACILFLSGTIWMTLKTSQPSLYWAPCMHWLESVYGSHCGTTASLFSPAFCTQRRTSWPCNQSGFTRILWASWSTSPWRCRYSFTFVRTTLYVVDSHRMWDLFRDTIKIHHSCAVYTTEGLS